MNHAVQALARLSHPREHRQRQLLEVFEPGQKRDAEALHRVGQRVTHFVGVGLHVAREQRLADDRQRERRHFRGHVDRRIGRDRLAPAQRVRDHRIGEALHLLAMEERLNGAALLEMRLALRGQQAFAEQPLGALQRDALRELLRRVHQHVFDPVRVADEIDLLRPEREARDVAVGSLRLGENRQRVAPELQEAGAGEPRRGSGNGLRIERQRSRHGSAYSDTRRGTLPPSLKLRRGRLRLR